MKRFAAGLAVLFLMVCATTAFAFGPVSKTYDGLDVSEYQGKIDFQKVAASGVKMVYIRSSLGYAYRDPYATRNADSAAHAGLRYGFYHFCTASTVDDAVKQARFFVDVTKGFSFDGRLVLELDPDRTLDKKATSDVALAFLAEIRALTEEDGAIYCSASTARDKYDKRLSKYPLWVADYGVAEPEANDVWSAWSGFQYSDHGRIDGIQGRVDLDKFTKAMLKESAAAQNDAA